MPLTNSQYFGALSRAGGTQALQPRLVVLPGSLRHKRSRAQSRSQYHHGERPRDNYLGVFIQLMSAVVRSRKSRDEQTRINRNFYKVVWSLLCPQPSLVGLIRPVLSPAANPRPEDRRWRAEHHHAYVGARSVHARRPDAAAFLKRADREQGGLGGRYSLSFFVRTLNIEDAHHNMPYPLRR